MSPKKGDPVERNDILQVKHNRLIDNIVRIKKSVLEKTISFNPVEIECRLELLNSYINQAMSNQNELEMVDPSNDSRTELENICVSTKALLMAILAKNHNKSNGGDASMCVQAPHQSKLPQMRLPKFSGKYSEYKNFIGLFDNLVDMDASLSNIEKFTHLLSCLSGDALGTIKAFQVTDENYQKALETLRKVYDNKCLIFFDTISQLFELPAMTKPSASALRTTIDTVSAIYESLRSLGDDKSITNAIIIHLVLSKIDPDSRVSYEGHLDYNKLPLWSDCEAVLNRRVPQLSAGEASKGSSANSKSAKNDKNQKDSSKSTLNVTKKNESSPSCAYCKASNHFITSCTSFSAIPVNARYDFVKGNQMCINCLRKGHVVAKCKSTKCRVCGKPHHTLLHMYATSTTQVASSAGNNASENSSTNGNASVNFTSCQEDRVILATAVIKVKDGSGQFQLARALLDSGSQVNFMSAELAQKLRLKKENSPLNITTIDSTSSTAKQRVQALCKSRVNDHQFVSEFYILKNISSFHPDITLPHSNWNVPKNIKLADPLFFKPQKIDLLIGAELFFDVLCVGQIKLGSQLPVLQKSLFGWIVSGKFAQKVVCHMNVGESGFVENPLALDLLLQKFWELEDVPGVAKLKYTAEQQACEEHFNTFVQNLKSGRIKVKLPFKGLPESLGISFEAAHRRYLALERKLAKNDDLKRMYNDFMNEYLELGHMSLAPSNITQGLHYFIPHQCVLRPESTSTKLRVVFDASCKTSSAVSLNDILMVGPFIQDDLFTILIRFRLNKYAITADITKMYRQVLIDEADRRFQLIVWRKKESDPVQTYQLNTVTYGTASAPFLATRSLVFLSERFEKSHPVGSRTLKRCFYVDDMLAGGQSIKDLEAIRSEVSNILKSAGFQLAKWFSNHPSLFSSGTAQKSLSFNEVDSTKTLGIRCCPKSDNFTFRLDPSFENLRATKRNILSVSSRLFDPLGLLCPLITKAKILLQELWLQKVDWDESIPQSLQDTWEKFKLNLTQLNRLSIPRFVNTHPRASLQIHGFADASIRAYGCCLYVRSKTSEGVNIILLTAKSKVAPIKTKSFPRLELCAAHLLTKLWCTVKPLLESFEINDITFWSDSEVVLHWLKIHPSTLTTFVANRVAEIQELSNDVQWLHVPSKHNPADIVSRGCYVDELKTSIWFNGPQFLFEEQSEWPKNKHCILTPQQSQLEVKKSSLVVSPQGNYLVELISRHSSFSKLIRIFCYLYNFKKLKESKTGEGTDFSVQERNHAFLKIVEVIQKHEFNNEIHKLAKNRPLQPQFQKLSPFIQQIKLKKRSFSLLRVGGRLLNAQLRYDAKFPLLMPKNSHFIMIYLKYLHLQHCHAGVKSLLSLLRQKIWVINAREACSRTVRQCVHCFHYKPKLLTQIMGQLPADRLRQIRPFAQCGIDFFGPVYVSLRIRGRPPVKMYVAVFVCFASKAVHLELVVDLFTDCFLFVLKRFIARRGVPHTIHCDNATNFVGASNALRELQEAFEHQRQKLDLFAAERGIVFKFIPPRAPHFGGLWEAAVKQAKHHLLRQIGNANLTADEVHTLLVEVEAMLNSRPIAAMSNDPNDGTALTPGQLLIGEEIVSLPQEFEPDVPDSKLTYLKRFRLLSVLKQRFWQAWSKDYILEQRARTKWLQEKPNLKKGALVLIHDDNLPPLRWMLGRVINVAIGKDNKVRAATIKTATGQFVRPIHKLAELPIG